MSRIFDDFEVGKRALLAQQAVLQTVGHNLANASTPGYTRQRVELAPVAVQNGVEVTAVRRIRDRYLDFSVLAEGQTLGTYQARQSILGRLEAAVTDPPDTGLGDVLDQFFAGFQALAADPTDQTLRVQLQDTGARLASSLRTLSGRIDQLQVDLTTQIQQHVSTANGLLGQIADINRQVLASGGQATPNDLLDRRDQLVEQLNSIVGVSATDRGDGTVQLAVAGSGVLLVDGVQTVPLSTSYDPSTDRIDLSAGGLSINPSGGQLAGVLSLRNSPTDAVKQAADALDTLARELIRQVNLIHASGTGLVEHTALTADNGVTSSSDPLSTAAGLPFDPSTGSFEVIVHSAGGAVVARTQVTVTAGVTSLDDIAAAIDANPELTATVTDGRLTINAASGRTFTFARDTSGALAALGVNAFFSGTGASDIALSSTVAGDPNKIATGQADAKGIVRPGDGSRAQAIADLADHLGMSGGTATFSSFIGTTIGGVGSRAREANDAVDRQTAAFGAVQSLQQQTSGVSVDEEMIQLTQAQFAYAAAGRYIDTVQNMIQSLLDMMTT